MKQHNSQRDYHRRMAQRRRRELNKKLPFLLLGILLAGIIGCGIFIIIKQLNGQKQRMGSSISSTSGVGESSSDSTSGESADSTQNEETSAPISFEIMAGVSDLLEDAQFIAAGYDYDTAIDMLKNSEYYGRDERVDAAVAEYEQIKTTLQPYDLTKITHVFFHTLVIDESKAFDGDEDEKGYNQVMTTKDEFLKMLQIMYDKGFVLVRLHDIAHEVTGEDGSVQLERGTILLPEGKQAFVMSQDDVCYYDYMKGDGFATRMVIGDDGKPTCEMEMDDGTTSRGSYDLVPLLEDFIQEHPDFSYRGARAVIAFTG